MPKSLSVRLLLIFITGFILLLSLLRLGIGHSLKSEIRDLHAMSVIRMTHIILERETLEVNFRRAMRVAQRTGMHVHILTDQRSWSSKGHVLNEKEYQFSAIKLHHKLPKKHRHEPVKIEVATGFNVNIYKVTTPKAILLFEIEKRNRNFGWHFILIASLFILLLYLAIRYQFAPVADITRVVREVSQGNFKARTKTRRKDDLGQLANQVNLMAEDIDRLIESKRSLLLGISHELRTPLTRAKVSSSLIEASKYRESLLDDIAEMETIITELTEAEKLSEDSPLARQVTDINSLILEVLNESFSRESITFTPLDETSYVNIDPIRVKLLVKNVLKNAVLHSSEAQLCPEISLKLTQEKLTIKIIDYGTGMPANVLNRLAEPFYRLDQSRQRKTGGYGLGLYLCKAITTAHRGELLISSEEGKGTEVKAILSLTD